MYTYIDHDLKQRPRQKSQQGQWQLSVWLAKCAGPNLQSRSFSELLTPGKNWQTLRSSTSNGSSLDIRMCIQTICMHTHFALTYVDFFGVYFGNAQGALDIWLAYADADGEEVKNMNAAQAEKNARFRSVSPSTPTRTSCNNCHAGIPAGRKDPSFCIYI